MDEGRFALTGATLTGLDDLFGVWDVPPAAAVQFGARAEPAWRVELPDSRPEAWAFLEQKRRALKRGEAHLAEAERRLSRVAAGGEGVSFAVGGPEAELQRALLAMEEPAAYAPDWRVDADRRKLFQRWRAFLDEVRAFVSRYAQVETEMAGALIGRTTVGWTGDFEVLLGPGATEEEMALHRESVRLALQSRIALIRLLTVVGTGAAKLALRLTVPGAQLLVLPAAWKFVRDVLHELREWPGRQ